MVDGGSTEPPCRDVVGESSNWGQESSHPGEIRKRKLVGQ